ncbi:serine carboxypeptidase [Vararia minispora EC-137]|uniref:Serine carboxypeptidase n=1 Tax=Vararia minispora EC-137 TaxID=1314806 RepID=A0ACB8QXH5_9AGAM|nr:serine carboxypeptidase [Vararia minispora EC-137]
MFRSILLAALALPTSVLSSQIPVADGVIGGVPASAAARQSVAKLSTDASTPTPGALRGVVENSGICETTPGVSQASGYGDIASDKSIWFWFFEARNNPDTAPLIAWFNGGPGSSSMIGLFQELGPCRITNDSSGVVLNPTSYTEFANVIFIDQPVGVGFSYGTLAVGTSQEAAQDVWEFFQIWFKDSRFSKFANREFGIWTESYGGHYGPTFAAYFLQQNSGIAQGTVSGLTINLKYLGVGDGLTDPLNQYPGYISYAAGNPYHALVSSSTITRANSSFWASNGCRSQIVACNNGGSDSVCSRAQSTCNNNILSPLAGNWDVYYILTQNPDPYPPALDSYLGSSNVTSAIGAQSTWSETNFNVYSNFAATGDWMRNSRPLLETVIDSGVRTIVFDGDADYILNFHGVEAMVDALQTKFTATYAAQSFANFTVNGVPAGVFKNAGTFSYVRIFGAGHEVPAYEWPGVPRGAAALQMFTQIMSNQSLSGT